MNKIKDRVMLSIIAGGIGSLIMLTIDKVSSRFGISQRSYLTTAAGVWVSSRREAEKWTGQLLGFIMHLGLSMVGALGLINLLTRYGRDKIVAKGLFFGVSFGAIITAILSGFANNKVKPKDAVSNLSYSLASALFGITTALVTSKLGHNSLFDADPLNNSVQPTEKTSEELKLTSPYAAK